MQSESSRPVMEEQQLRSWKLLGEFSRRLRTTTSSEPSVPSRGGPPRRLSEEDYLCAFLFAQFNPIIDSARGLCACSDLERVQQEVCSRHLSLGSFSEAQHVFGSSRLEQVFAGLLQEDQEIFSPPGCREARRLAIDSTVIQALPRMHWAEWRYQKTHQSALRLHVKLNLLTGEPAGVSLTPARTCERKAFAEMLQPGEFYVGDRNYGRDYQLLQELDQLGCGYIIRLCTTANYTLQQALPIGEADRQAGVVFDGIVRLGAAPRWYYSPVRLVQIDREDLKEPLWILTNRLDPECYSAALVGEIYRSRWRIELFFRWFKCVLGRSDQWHWMAQGQNGVAIQIYCALIAALLLARRNGKLPNKRQMELLRFHAMGMASVDELVVLLKLKSKKSSGSPQS